MVTYPAFWLFCCNSLVYSLSAAVKHSEVPKNLQLSQENLNFFYLNPSNKIQTPFLSLLSPNAHILPSSYRTI